MNEEIIRLGRKGKSTEEIAEILGIGVEEVYKATSLLNI